MPRTPYENNDTPLTAVPLPANATNLVSEYGDEDYWSLVVPAYSTVSISTAFAHSLGDIDTRLFVGGIQVFVSAGSSDTEVVEYENTEASPAAVILQVQMYSIDGCNTYSVTPTILVGAVCPLDVEDPNDTVASATPLIGTALTNLITSPTDPDVFTFTVGPDAFFFADVHAGSGDSSGMGLQLVVRDQSGATVDSVSASPYTVGFVNAGTADRTYSLMVTGQTCISYDLENGVFPVDCLPDAYELNDQFAEAVFLPSTGLSNVSAVLSDDDYWVVTVPAHTILNLTTAFAHLDGDIDVALYTAGGALLLQGTSTSDNEVVEYSNRTDSPVDLVLRVGMYGGIGCNTYTLLPRFRPVVLCEPDLFEPNDEGGEATVLDGTPLTALTTVDTDPDVFTFTLQPGEGFEGLVTALGGGLTMEVFDSSGASLDYDLFPPYDVLLTNEGAAPETYELWILGELDCSLYSLENTVVPVGVCVPDAYEDNDLQSMATPLSAGSYADLNVEPTDADYYTVALAVDGVLQAAIEPTSAGGSPEISFLTAAGSLLDGPSFGSLTYANRTGIPELVYVRVLSDRCAEYGLDVAIGLCEDDDLYEPNDTVAAAVPLTDGTGLIVREGSDDFFSLGTVSHGGTIQVSLIFEHDFGDIDIELWTGSGTGAIPDTVGGGAASNDEVVTWTNLTGFDREVYGNIFLYLPSTCDTNTYAMSTVITP